MSSMNQLLSQYLDPLLRGRRKDCRDIVKSALAEGIAPKHLYHDVLWPAMARVDQMYRGDQINVAAEHMATRINRTVADHLQTRLDRKPAINRCILITSAEGEAEEFSAQMCSDLFEAEGWDVFLVGGGVPQDEIVELVGQIRPDILLVVGSRPQDAPGVRALIEAVHQINACPTMNVMVSGGVFNRAGELWKEVKADLFAATAGEALELALEATPRTPQSIDPNAPKKRRRRRRPALLLATEGHA